MHVAEASATYVKTSANLLVTREQLVDNIISDGVARLGAASAQSIIIYVYGYIIFKHIYVYIKKYTASYIYIYIYTLKYIHIYICITEIDIVI